MAHDPNLWTPANIPDNLESPSALLSRLKDPEVVAALKLAMQIQQNANVRVSRALKILNRFRVVMDADEPVATGSGFLWINTADSTVWYDDPAEDPATWIEIAPGSGSGTKLDTTDFTDKLSAADDDVQKALDTLDDHNHNADYLPAAIGGGPVAGHLTELAAIAIPPPDWALVDSGYSVDDFFIVEDAAMREFAVADAQPNKYLNYVGGVLDTIDIYDATPTKLYEKQFNYVGGVLDNIVLTRLSDMATWTKTLTYVGGVLEEVEVA